jgi:HdeA/HdeB family
VTATTPSLRRYSGLGFLLRRPLRCFLIKPMEVIVKVRLLLTSALLMFVQIPAQAQVTVDVAKVTCDELFKEETQWTSGEIIFWLSGYYHGEGHNTIVQPGALKRDEEKLNQYCYGHGDTTVMDAVKDMGLGK